MRAERTFTTAILVIILLLCSSRFSDAATLGLAWDPPTDGVTTGYIVRYGTTPGSHTQSINVGMVTSHSVTTLADGVTYYFVVQAYNASGQLGPLSTEVVGLTRPAAPLNLAAGVSGSTATLTWQAPSGTVTGYRVEVGTASGQSNVAAIDTGAVTTYLLNTLSAGTYYVRVRSLNSAGASAPSNEIVMTLTAATLPPPTSLAGAARNNQYIDLTWVAPGATVTGYRIEVGTASGQSNVTTVNTGTATSYTLSGLTAGTYYIRVRSVNGSSLSAPSNEVNVVLSAVLGTPSNLTANVRSNQYVDLAWQAASGSVTGYRVYVGTSPGQSNVATIDVGAATTHTLNGLNPGTYYICVRAMNGTLLSGPSNEVAATIATSVDVPTNVTATVRNNQYVDVAWQAPSGTVTGYRVEVGTGPGQSNVTTATVGVVSTYTINGLTPGTYYIRVRALNSTLVSAPSNEATATITDRAIQAPSNLRANVRDGKNLDLAWDAVSSTLEGYRVDIGTSAGQANVRSTNVAANVTSLTMTDLRGGPYFIRVRTVVGTQTSEPSNEVQALLEPSAPTALSAKVTRRTNIDLSWQPGAGALAYSIEVGTATGLSNVRVISTTAATYMINDLPTGTFFIRVRGQNNVGSSTPSNEVRVSVTAGKSKPNAPSNFSATMQDSKLIELSWNPDEEALFYRVELGTTPGATDVSNFTTGATTSFTIGELPARKYYVRVRAANDEGLSDPSTEIMLTGHGGSDAPQRLAAMVNPAGLVRLTWDPPIDAVGVTGYVIEAGAGPGRSDLGVIPAHGQSFAIGAIPNGTYFVRVRAVMASGPGAASNEVVLQVGTQQQCTAAPAAPRLSTSVAGSILELVWAPGVGDAPTGYILDVGTTPGRRDIISVPLGADITTLSAQVEDGTYALRLTAVNGCGASAWGSDATVTIGGPALALPGAPTNLTEQVNGRAATLTWAPAASGGEPTTYRLEVLAPNGLVILTLDTGNVSTTFTHDNVPPGQYTVRVRGVNARGAGAPSNAVVLTIQ